MSDLIDRQQVIDSVKDALLAWSSMPQWRDDKITQALVGLPSAQPEIIRCKDCVYRYVNGSKVRLNCCKLNHNNVQSDDWYGADAERRDDE